MKFIHRLTVSLLLLALLAVPTFAVLAKELGLLTISGPGIKGEMTLDDPSELQSLWEAGIIDTNGFAKAPEDLGQGYTITTYMRIEADKMIPFIQMVYYPAEAGQQGYVHIIGRLEQGDTLSPADQWTRMTIGADKALRMVMKGHNVQLQAGVVLPGAPAAKPEVVEPAAAAQSAPAVSPTVAWIAIALTLLAGAGLLLRRRTLGRTTV